MFTVTLLFLMSISTLSNRDLYLSVLRPLADISCPSFIKSPSSISELTFLYPDVCGICNFSNISKIVHDSPIDALSIFDVSSSLYALRMDWQIDGSDIVNLFWDWSFFDLILHRLSRNFLSSPSAPAPKNSLNTESSFSNSSMD